MCTVSIILPVYNSEKKIQKTIDSILNQTYNDYELIIINDGSTDSTSSICIDNQKKNPNNIIYVEQENKGVSNARNYGISMSHGKYIMFIDSDDTYEPNMVKKMVEILLNTDKEWGVCGYNRINEKYGSKIKKNIPKVEMSDDGITCQLFIEKLQKNNLFNQIWNKIYISTIIKSNNIRFDDKMSLSEDLKFNLEYIKNIKKAIYLDETLYSYINSTSGLNLKYQEKRLTYNLNTYFIQKNLYLNRSYNTEYLDGKYLKVCMSGIKNIVNNPNKKQRMKVISEFIQNTELKMELEWIRKKAKLKNKLVIDLLLSKNKYFLFFMAYILNEFDKIYKKVILGY